MKVFMLGWEFPPYISGGLGTACYGITRGLDQIGVDVSFVLPTSVPAESDPTPHVQLRSPATLAQPPAGGGEPAAGGEAPGEEAFEHVRLHRVDAALQAYASPTPAEEAVLQKLLTASQRPPAAEQGQSPPETVDLDKAESHAAAAMPTGTFAQGPGQVPHYGGDLMAQIHRYARLSVELAARESFDVIHAHDWMTYPAAVAVAAATGKPLVVHIHSTEFDRSGENINQQVYEIERSGMHAARRVVCVSHLTCDTIVRRYGVSPDKVDVIYNAVDLPQGRELEMPPIRGDERIVLFLGRVTMQKGPEYFLHAAKKVVERLGNVRFVMAGTGDMMQRMVELVADLRLGRYVTFTGFLRGGDVQRIFRMADLYVMPSVSEPFGIAPLEAMSHNVPVIISKQSGVSEVITHALKVDFWDTDEMANKILAVLRHPPLQRTLRQHGQIELYKLRWRDTAQRLRDLYEKVLSG